MNKQKQFEQLHKELQKLESTFQAHNDVPGHPDFCVQQSIQIKVWDCLLGTPESPANVWVDWTASLDRKKVLKALRMAVKRMEYDIKLDGFFRLRDELQRDRAADNEADRTAVANAAAVPGESPNGHGPGKRQLAVA